MKVQSLQIIENYSTLKGLYCTDRNVRIKSRSLFTCSLGGTVVFALCVSSMRSKTCLGQASTRSFLRVYCTVFKVILIWQTSSSPSHWLTYWCALYWFSDRTAFLLFPVREHPEESVNGALLTPTQSSFTCCSHKGPFTLNIHYCRTV